MTFTCIVLILLFGTYYLIRLARIALLEIRFKVHVFDNDERWTAWLMDTSNGTNSSEIQYARNNRMHIASFSGLHSRLHNIDLLKVCRLFWVWDLSKLATDTNLYFASLEPTPDSIFTRRILDYSK